MGEDQLTVPQYGHVVAHFEDLLEVVRYVQDRHPGRHQGPDSVEKPADLGPLERRGGFVQEQASPPRRQGPGDLHQLALLDSERGAGRPRRHIAETPFGKYPVRLCPHGFPIDKS